MNHATSTEAIELLLSKQPMYDDVMELDNLFRVRCCKCGNVGHRQQAILELDDLIIPKLLMLDFQEMAAVEGNGLIHSLICRRRS